MYEEEKFIAREFLAKYGNDCLVILTLAKITDSSYTHSERWSIVYDMICDNYPEWKAKGTVTGLVYLVEDGEI